MRKVWFFITNILNYFKPIFIKKRLINSVLGEDSLNTNYWTSMVNEYLDNPSQDNRNNLSWRFEQLLFQFFELGEIHLF